MRKFTVIDGGGGGEAPPPPTNASTMGASLHAMVEECLKTKPTVAMLVWESGDGHTTQLLSLITPPAQAVFRGLVELLSEQISQD